MFVITNSEGMSVKFAVFGLRISTGTAARDNTVCFNKITAWRVRLWVCSVHQRCVRYSWDFTPSVREDVRTIHGHISLTQSHSHTHMHTHTHTHTHTITSTHTHTHTHPNRGIDPFDYRVYGRLVGASFRHVSGISF